MKKMMMKAEKGRPNVGKDPKVKGKVPVEADQSRSTSKLTNMTAAKKKVR